MKTAAIQVQEYMEVNRNKAGDLNEIAQRLRLLATSYIGTRLNLAVMQAQLKDKQLYSDQGIIDITAFITASVESLWQSILLLEVLGIHSEDVWNEIYLKKLTGQSPNFEQFTKAAIDTISANNPGVEF